MTIKPYKFPKKKKSRPFETVDRLTRAVDERPLTGFVADIEASPEEERFARALRENNIGFSFQYEIPVLTSLPGEEKVVDFVIGIRRQPVEVYGRIGHETNSDKSRDRIREIMINEEMRIKGIPLLKVVWYYELEDQDQANAVVGERFA